MAVEEVEEVAVQKAAALAVAEKRRLEDERGGDFESDKRTRLVVQDDGGVHNQGEKKFVKVLIDIEGGMHATRIKTDLAEREKNLDVVLRVCHSRRWKHIMRTECVLQVEEYAVASLGLRAWD